ncbi:MAG: acyltransferase [Acetobacteraceae bacterium]
MINNQDYTTTRATSAVVANLDAVRGLACLLVVSFHVVGETESNGLRLPATSAWHHAMQSIEFLRIPLFTAMSGYLYAGRRVLRSEFTQFWQKKWRRLAIPYVFVTCVIWLLRSVTAENPTSLPDELVAASTHLWFLQALLLLFAAISIADIIFRPGPIVLMLVGLVAIMLAQSGLPITTDFGLAGACYLAPYFLFGIILREHPQWLRDPQSGLLALGIILIVLASQQLGLFGLAVRVEALQLPAALAGLAGVVFFLQRVPNNALLASIGVYSYTIYLWHVLASASVRAALVKLGVTSVPVLFVLCFVAAVIAPIVLYHAARRIPWVSIAVTGERDRASPRQARRPLPRTA